MKTGEVLPQEIIDAAWVEAAVQDAYNKRVAPEIELDASPRFLSALNDLSENENPTEGDVDVARQIGLAARARRRAIKPFESEEE